MQNTYRYECQYENSKYFLLFKSVDWMRIELTILKS